MYRVIVYISKDILSAYTKQSSKKALVKEWGNKLKETYPNQIVLVQKKVDNKWQDWRLIEDF